MVTTLAIDPGKRIGWCLFGDGKEIERGVTDWGGLVRGFGELDDYLGGHLTFLDYVIGEVVIENYVNDPGTPQGGQENPAAEVIGAVRILCAQTNTRFTRQPASTLSVAMKHAGYTPPKTRTGNKKHLPDEDSAFLHGFYYEIVHGRAQPVPLD
jgi:hypothetical protein